MKTDEENKQDDTQNASAVRDCLTRLVIWLRCSLRGCDFRIEQELSLNADLVQCKRCGKRFAYKHTGDFAGCYLPWSDEVEEMYRLMGGNFDNDEPTRRERTITIKSRTTMGNETTKPQDDEPRQALSTPPCSAWTPAKVFTAAIGWDIKCPQCGTFSSTVNSLHTCAGCGSPWRKKRGHNNYEFLCKPNVEDRQPASE